VSFGQSRCWVKGTLNLWSRYFKSIGWWELNFDSKSIVRRGVLVLGHYLELNGKSGLNLQPFQTVWKLFTDIKLRGKFLRNFCECIWSFVLQKTGSFTALFISLDYNDFTLELHAKLNLVEFYHIQDDRFGISEENKKELLPDISTERVVPIANMGCWLNYSVSEN
jgi:hypothetical protein